MTAVDPVEALALELRILLRKGVVDLVDPAELAILYRIVSDPVVGVRPRVVSLQPVLDLGIAGVADQETRLALEVLLGHSDLRYRSLKERGTRAAGIVGVSYDAYRRARKGRIHRDLLVLAAQIAVQYPGSMMAAAAGPVDEQKDSCEFCGSDVGYPKLRAVAI